MSRRSHPVIVHPVWTPRTQEKAVSSPQEAFWGVAASLQSLADQALLDAASQPAVPVPCKEENSQ